MKAGIGSRIETAVLHRVSVDPGAGSDPHCSVMFVGARTGEPKEKHEAALKASLPA
jgi:hypothetical protein